MHDAHRSRPYPWICRLNLSRFHINFTMLKVIFLLCSNYINFILFLNYLNLNLLKAH